MTIGFIVGCSIILIVIFGILYWVTESITEATLILICAVSVTVLIAYSAALITGDIIL